MPYIKDLDLCEFYACKNPQHEGVTVTVTLPNEETLVEVKPCLYHQSVLERGSDFYSVGRTYRGEIELRPIAAQFAPPATPTTPTEE